MSNSAVDWLGEIPEHWEVKKLKWCVTQKTKKTSDKTNTIALENVESWTGRYIETESEFEGDGVSFDKEDILFGKLRPYLAKVYRATEPGEAMGDFFVLEPKQNLMSQFLEKLLISSKFIETVNSSAYGSKMPRVNWEYFSSIEIPLPPINEQMDILNHLDIVNKQLENLILTTKNSIDLLQERRFALISAAVTGKLDVRSYIAKEAA
jgi:type I restriction enzyme, S subunit